MIELQVISDLLHNNNLMDYLAEGITSEYFEEHKEEFDFIVQHYRTYNKVPDLATFMSKYPEFELIEVMEPVKYLSYNLKEDYVFRALPNHFKKWAKLSEENSLTALNTIIDDCNALLEKVSKKVDK